MSRCDRAGVPVEAACSAASSLGASSRELYSDVLARIERKLREEEPTFSELAQIAAVTGRYGRVGDDPKDGELIVTLVRTSEPPPSR